MPNYAIKHFPQKLVSPKLGPSIAIHGVCCVEWMHGLTNILANKYDENILFANMACRTGKKEGNYGKKWGRGKKAKKERKKRDITQH